MVVGATLTSYNHNVSPTFYFTCEQTLGIEVIALAKMQKYKHASNCVDACFTLLCMLMHGVKRIGEMFQGSSTRKGSLKQMARSGIPVL